MAVPVIAYIRVSRVGGREGESFLSPDLQREACQREAEKSGLTIIDTYEGVAHLNIASLQEVVVRAVMIDERHDEEALRMLVRMWSPYYTKQRRSTTSLHPRSSVNNDPDNLQVVTRRQHFYMHMVRDYDRPWGEEEIARAVALYAMGLSIDEVSREVGRSYYATRRRLSREAVLRTGAATRAFKATAERAALAA